MVKRIKKHTEKINEKKIKLLNYISFLFGFCQALLLYVLSDYFRQAMGYDDVSVFYFAAYTLALIGLLNLSKIVNRFGKSTVFFLFFFVQICLVTFLIFLNPSALGVIALMLYIVINYLTLVMLDIILESYSEDRKSGRIRGAHLTILNAGFILGPFLSTKILSTLGFDGLFLIALFGYMIIFVVALLGLQTVKRTYQKQLTVSDLIKKIFVNKDLVKIYSISFVLEFFYALMIVYTPLYLLDLGLSWQQIGIIFTIMLIPFVALEYPLGFLADKKFGEKEMLFVGVAIMSLSAGSIFFVSSTSVFIWSLVLFATRLGAATVEILRDSYFYKKIDGKDADVISFFRTASSVAFICATALSALLLIFLPIKFVFLLVMAVVMIGLYPAYKLVDNKSESELQLEYEKIEV